MSDIYDIKVLLKAQVDESTKIVKSIDEINQRANKLAEQATTLGKVWSGALYGVGNQLAGLAQKIPNLATESIKAFGQQEIAVRKLTAAVRENGGNVSEVLPAMQRFASDMQKITNYGNEEIIAMQAVATSMGVMSGQMENVIQNAVGLSTAFGMDLQTATKAASAAIQGKTELLTRYIPTLSACKTEAEKLALVQERARKGFAQAQEAADGLDGRLRAAANAWGDLQKVVGEAFAPTVKAVAGLLQGVCETLANMPALTKALTISLASLAVGFAFTKVGGLLNVAKMFVTLGTSIKGATGAMHAFNLAVKSNPIGLLASAVTAAVLGLMSLAEYLGTLESEEEKEREAQRAANAERRKAAQDARNAANVLSEYEKTIRISGESATETAERIEALKREIAELSDTAKWKDNEQTAAAQKLVEKKKELAEVQRTYLERVRASAEAEYKFAAGREVERKYRLEMELNAARKTGIAHIIKYKEAELRHVELLQKSAEIQRKYYADHEHLVQTEEDRIRIMGEAEKYAKMAIADLRKEGEAEKYLSEASEKSADAQRGLELDILRARADGNENLAKEIEGKLRIAQLSKEIFEASRKEGMSRKELQALQNSAEEQARERYNLEKSITEEAERQNLAKNAQAKIEDIILQNKIEQLKAQGKLDAAKALEREREINRTLAGLDGVSDENKEKLAKMMRQTNSYRDMQDQSRGGSRIAGGMSGGFYGGGDGGVYGGASRGGIPATVSAKYADLYNQWKEEGGAKSGMSWSEYRAQAENQQSAGGESGYSGGRGMTGGRSMDNAETGVGTKSRKNPLNFSKSGGNPLNFSKSGGNPLNFQKSGQKSSTDLSIGARSFISFAKNIAENVAKNDSNKTRTSPNTNTNTNNKSNEKNETQQQTPARAELSNRTSSPAAGGNTQSQLLTAVLSIERAVRGLEQTRI